MSIRFVRSIADLSSRCRNRLWPSKELSDEPESARRGRLGEDQACRFLRKNGYKILYRNFEGRTGGEIDIICRDQEVLVFVEVKTRSTDYFGRPFDAVRRDQRGGSPAGPWPGCGCWIIRRSCSGSTWWK